MPIDPQRPHPRAISFWRPQAFRRRLGELRAFLLVAFDTLALPLLRIGLSKPRKAKPSVAVFALHGAGDLILSLPCLEQIRIRYPAEAYSLILYCQPAAAELAGRYAPADRLIAIDRHRMLRSLCYRLTALRAIIAQRHAAAVQPCYNRMLGVEDSLVRASGAGERLGSAGSPAFAGPAARWLGDCWYHRLIQPAAQPMHELDRYSEFLEGLGWPAPPKTLPTFALPDSADAIAPGYLLIIPDSSSPLKSWPMEKFEQLTLRLADGIADRIVIAGRQAPQEMAQRLVRQRPDHIHDRSGNTSIVDFLCLIHGASQIITNDSGALHFAVLLRRPVLAIAGGGLPDRYHPYPTWAGARLTIVERRLPCYGCNWNCIHNVARGAPAPCIGDVEVTEVLAALAGRANSQGR